MATSSFTTKTIIVTGSASGIGLSTTNMLLTAGATVFGIDISPCPAPLSNHPNYTHHIANLSQRGVPAAAVAACVAAYGPRIDALLNVAGISDHMSSVDTLTDDDWDRVIAVNLTAPVSLMRAVVPIMLAHSPPMGGSIVNVCSLAASSGSLAGVAYTASKHGLLGATRNVAYRFKANGIRCNAVCPGPTATNIANSMDGKKMDLVAMGVYAESLSARGVDVRTGGGISSAAEVAAMIVFLAGDGAVGVSGASIDVGGGGCAI